MAHRIRSAIFLAVALAAVAVIGAASPALAAPAGDDLTLLAPEHAKTISRNEDGTWRLTLSVTGDTAESVQAVPTDVVVIQDLSNSMNISSGTSYASVKKPSKAQLDASNKADSMTHYFGVVNGYWVQLYWRGGTNGSIQYYSQNSGSYTWQRYTGAKYYRGTSRLDVSKAALDNLADALIGPGAPESSDVRLRVVTFGRQAQAASQPFGRGQTAAFKAYVEDMKAPYNYSTNWDDAFRKVQAAVAGSNRTTYVVFLSDGSPTAYIDNKGQVAGAGTSTDNTAFLRAVAQANALSPVVREIYPVYTATGARKAMTDFAARITRPSNTAYNGTNLDELNAVLGDIAQTVTNTAGYRNVTITDVLSPYVEFVAGDTRSNVACQYRDGADGPLVSMDASSVVFDGNRVAWAVSDPDGGGALVRGRTYYLSFDVRPTAAAPEFVAGQGQAPVSLPTNTDDGSSNVSYDVVTSVGGVESVSPGSAPYDPPSIPMTRISVSKTVSGSMADPSEHFPVVVSGLRPGPYHVTFMGVSADDGEAHGSGPVTVGADGTVSLALRHGETAVVSGLEAGDAVTVTETYGARAARTTTATLNGEAAELSSGSAGSDVSFSLPVAVPADGAPQHVMFDNRTDAVAQTAVSVDFAPYVAMAGVAGMATTAMVAGRVDRGRKE